MAPRSKPRIMMISTHGYVSAEPEFGLPDTGGQVVYVLELSKHLGRLGYHVDILTRQFERQPRVEPVAERVRILRFPCGGKEFIPKETLCRHIPEWVENAASFIQSKRLRYAFINSHYWDAGLAGQALAHRFNISHLHTPHSIGSWKRDNMDGAAEELEAKYNFRERIREEKCIYDECDAVIATTPVQRDILDRGEYDVPRDKLFVVPPGYEDTRFFPVSMATRQTLKQELGMEGKTVLALGRMAHNKGYDLLLQAMPVVFERIEDSRLHLAIGSTEPNEREKEQIQELKNLAVALHIDDRVRFSDYIEDPDLPDYYRAADVFALCSRYEPFGMTAVEAMAWRDPHGRHYRRWPVGTGGLGPGGHLCQPLRLRGLRPCDLPGLAASAHRWTTGQIRLPESARRVYLERRCPADPASDWQTTAADQGRSLPPLPTDQGRVAGDGDYVVRSVTR